MPPLDIAQTLKDMASAASGVLKNKWPDAKSFAETEFQKIAQTIVSIGEQRAAGTINNQQAELLLDMQKNASRAVLLTIEGLGILAVEEAINAALGAVSKAVNTAVGFVLIP